MATDNKGRIYTYTGGFSEFSFSWAYNRVSRFTYHSLVKLMSRGLCLTNEIWKIYVLDDLVIFQSFGVTGGARSSI